MTDTDASTTPTSQALAKVDNSPRAMIKRHQDKLAEVLPTHIAKPEAWIRVAAGALRKGKLYNGGPATELEVAANNDPGKFLATLLDCARLGLEPGTEQYYLTPREVKGRLEILGIVGYQGLVELAYRSGAVSSIVAEAVYSNDSFRFRPGLDEIPVHEIDWDAENRGELRLVYAYARMKGGATSKVVVLNKAAINRIKKSAQGTTGKYSPWVNHTESMWLKSAVRQLSKWIPTSAEYRNQQVVANAAMDASRQAIGADMGAELPVVSEDNYSDDDVVEAEIVDDGYDPEDPERPFTYDDPGSLT